MRRLLFSFALLCVPFSASAGSLLLTPDAVFDGTARHAGWAVLVSDGRVAAAGPAASIAVPDGVQRVDLAGMTLLPGLIEAHSHILLHPYDETSWTDQVLRESRAERVARATVHLRAHLRAGFTTLRDLGTEGAGYADVGLRDALAKGVIEGPRLVVAGPAIVATGSYGPKGFAPHVAVPLGAEEADGTTLIRVARRQIGHGVDVVKVYADYRWGPNGTARPTFALEELASLVTIAADAGRPVIAHATTAEGMRRAALAGVRSIEHGDEGTPEVFALMAARHVVWCPTLAAGEAIAAYAGWHKGRDPVPARVARKKATFRAALAAGVEICMGSDVGVFTHGDSVREMELMVEYGMTPAAVLGAATATNARLLGLEDEIGRIAPGFDADLVAVAGDPTRDISALRAVALVVRHGRVIFHPGGDETHAP